MVTIADRLNWLLTERHMSLNQLSIESGIAYMTLSNLIKTGGEQTRLPTLRKLADFFGLTLDEFILGRRPEREYQAKIEAPAQTEQELSEQDHQIIAMLPFVPETVKAGVLQIFAATTDLAAAAESARHDIEEARALAAQADSEYNQQQRRG